MLENHSPDIITGCELDNEVITGNYKLYRKDRKDGYGGVLIGIKSNLLSKPIDFNTPCETCAAIIQLSLNQQLVVINVYRPPNRDLEYQQELCDCICEIVRSYPNSFIICAGDFNLPDIDWTSNSIVNHQHPLDVSRFILTTAAECYFTQLVDIPTRGEKILDIVFTNRPSYINYCTVQTCNKLTSSHVCLHATCTQAHRFISHASSLANNTRNTRGTRVFINQYLAYLNLTI